MIGIESGKHFACAAFVRTTVVTIIPSPLQRLHEFGYNGIVRIHLSTWLVLQLEGSVHSVPRDVTLPSLDTGELTAVKGPAGALKHYLSKIGWQITRQGVVLTDTVLNFPLLLTPTKEIAMYVHQAWMRVVCLEIAHRNGLSNPPEIDKKCTFAVWSKFNDKQKHYIALSLTGAWQSEAKKSVWLKDHDVSCPICGEIDTFAHRHFECPSASELRSKYLDLLDNIDVNNIRWRLPVCFRHEDHEALHLINSVREKKPCIDTNSLLRFLMPGQIPFFLYRRIRTEGKMRFIPNCNLGHNPKHRYKPLSNRV